MKILLHGSCFNSIESSLWKQSDFGSNNLKSGFKWNAESNRCDKGRYWEVHLGSVPYLRISIISCWRLSHPTRFFSTRRLQTQQVHCINHHHLVPNNNDTRIPHTKNDTYLFEWARQAISFGFLQTTNRRYSSLYLHYQIWRALCFGRSARTRLLFLLVWRKL